jgi:hypothetical protein
MMIVMTIEAMSTSISVKARERRRAAFGVAHLAVRQNAGDAGVRSGGFMGESGLVGTGLFIAVIHLCEKEKTGAHFLLQDFIGQQLGTK